MLAGPSVAHSALIQHDHGSVRGAVIRQLYRTHGYKVLIRLMLKAETEYLRLPHDLHFCLKRDLAEDLSCHIWILRVGRTSKIA